MNPNRKATFRLIIQRWADMALPLTVGAFCLGAPLIAFVWFCYGDSLDLWRHQRSFDAVLWRAEPSVDQARNSRDERDWPPRLCMVHDLLASGRLNGMTKSQVLEVLGRPDAGAPPERHDWSYRLGPRPGRYRESTSDELVIRFDDTAKLTGHWVYRARD
jgi:hypothetical protein